MRILGIAVAALALAACSKKDEAPAVDTTAAVVTPAAPAALTVADLQGTWDVEVRNEAGDSVLTGYVLTVPADTSAWTMVFTGRKEPIATHIVAMAGDSVSVHAGPFPSVLRKDIKVTTATTHRLVDGKLVGKTVARYDVKTADSVRTLNLSGTKR